MTGFNQRGMSRRVLADDLLERMGGQGACKGQSALWADSETRHLAATTKLAATDAAAPALDLCQDCPVVALCNQWATVDRYTGLAAGLAWTDGKSRRAEITRFEGGLDPQLRAMAQARVDALVARLALEPEPELEPTVDGQRWG